MSHPFLTNKHFSVPVYLLHLVDCCYMGCCFKNPCLYLICKKLASCRPLACHDNIKGNVVNKEKWSPWVREVFIGLSWFAYVCDVGSSCDDCRLPVNLVEGANSKSLSFLVNYGSKEIK